MSLIGQMRNRIVLQTLSTSSDGAGGQSASFGTATTVWAKVENLSGSEYRCRQIYFNQNTCRSAQA